MEFPGTISIQSRTLIALLLDLFKSIDEQGVRKLVLLNAHGANRAAADTACHDYFANKPDTALRFLCVSWWELGDVPKMRHDFFGQAEGLHATPSEISITQAISRLVKPAEMPIHQPLSAGQIAILSGDRHGPSQEHREKFPDGCVGSDPSMAAPELGAKLFQAAVSGLVDLLKAQKAGQQQG